MIIVAIGTGSTSNNYISHIYYRMKSILVVNDRS